MNIIWFVIIGAFAGWLAGLIMKGRGFGFLGNLAVGIVGAIAGGFLFDVLGIYPEPSLLGSLLTAVIGAVLLLALVSAFKKTK
jgi:uncharacterized membrane protein YeaQ/YmgE (transglycosylase-associated protein family)